MTKEAQDAAARERKAVVDWLRGQAGKGAEKANASTEYSTKWYAHGGGVLALDRAADAIERGEHIGDGA